MDNKKSRDNKGLENERRIDQLVNLVKTQERKDIWKSIQTYHHLLIISNMLRKSKGSAVIR